MEKTVKKILTAYKIAEDEAIWNQIKQQILLTCRFDAREWELEYTLPIIEEGTLKGHARLVPKEKKEK